MPGKPEVQPQILLPANQTTRFLKSSNLYYAKVASLDAYIILKETSGATDIVFSSPVQSTGRAIVVTLSSAFAFALALALAFPSRHF